MKVVVNALAYRQNSSGIGVLMRELFGAYCRRTKRPCEVVLSADAPDFPAGERTALVRIQQKNGQGVRRMLFQTFGLGRRCRDAALLTTDSKTPFFLPRSCKLVPLVTDLALYRMPEVYQRSRALLWRAQYRYVRRRAALYLTISEFTRRELVELFGVEPSRVRVVPCACSSQMRRVEDAAALARVRAAYGLPERFILFVGNANPRKNLGRMIEAYGLLRERTALTLPLVIAGGQGWRFDREAALQGARHAQDVRFIGFVPDEDMPALYSAADAFCFPTLYEGFGIPVVEAQACGVPVVTSAVSALPETAGDGAVLVNPYDPGDICDGLLRILLDGEFASALTRRGYENARRFSWEASAARLDEILESEIMEEKTI